MPAQGESASGGKLIIGLGNPGKQYQNTWHNLGFLAVDEMQKKWGFEKFKNEKKWQAEISIGQFNNEKIILAKPQTFMNNSGEAVVKIAKYYKIKLDDIIVIHDDVDLGLEKIRIAKDSSAGGHNGIKSIIQQIKSQNFIRIKIGIATDRKNKMESADYVLSRFGLFQKKKVKEITKKITSAIEVIITDSLESAMNQYN